MKMTVLVLVLSRACSWCNSMFICLYVYDNDAFYSFTRATEKREGKRNGNQDTNQPTYQPPGERKKNTPFFCLQSRVHIIKKNKKTPC